MPIIYPTTVIIAWRLPLILSVSSVHFNQKYGEGQTMADIVIK